MNIETKLNKKNNTIRNWHVALALIRGTIVTWHVDTFFEIKKNFQKKLKILKKLKKIKKTRSWHVACTIQKR